MTNTCCFHSCGQIAVSHIFMHSKCKIFTAVGPLALTSSAGILSKPGALSECRSLIALSTSDSSGDGSLSTQLKSMVCISISLSFFWKNSSPYSFHLPRISVGLLSAMPVLLCTAIFLGVKVLFFTFFTWSNNFFEFLTLSYSSIFLHSCSSHLFFSVHNDLCNLDFSLWYDCWSFLFLAFLFCSAIFSEVALIHGLGFTYFLSPRTSTAVCTKHLIP